MGVLLKKSEYNWIPKSAFHFALVNDIIRLKDSARWILEEAEVIKKMHLYTFDLRMKNGKELQEFLMVIKSVMAINKEIEGIGDNELYLELLNELSVSLKKQIKSDDYVQSDDSLVL